MQDTNIISENMSFETTLQKFNIRIYITSIAYKLYIENHTHVKYLSYIVT